MKSLDEYAAEAKRAIGRWYGRTAHFDDRRPVYVPFEDFIRGHWRRFPSTDPQGRQIIDGEAVEIVGFVSKPPPRLSGDCCQECGSFAMVRTGTCLTCMACGSSSGGCS